MRFIKGMMLGGIITTGIVVMYNKKEVINKRKMMKKGKQLAKKMGIM